MHYFKNVFMMYFLNIFLSILILYITMFLCIYYKYGTIKYQTKLPLLK